MMSQTFRPMWGVLEPRMVRLAGNWAIGATGAVGAQIGANGMSLTRTAVDRYTIQLLGSKGVSTRAQAILHAVATLFNSDTDPTDDTDAHFMKMLSKTDSTGVILIQCVDEAGVVREAPSGSFISVGLDVRLSSAR